MHGLACLVAYGPLRQHSDGFIYRLTQEFLLDNYR